MATGTLKWFDKTKGFGFIVPGDGGADVFVHLQQFEALKIDPPLPGTKLSYEIQTRGSRVSAEKLSILTPAPSSLSIEETVLKNMARRPKVALDPDEEFEREWGLKRAF